MSLPPFTARSCALWLVGVVAALLGIYFLIAALIHAQPRVRIPPSPPASTSN
jgi:cytochrome c-type biogenesis protein CcmH/NrfF